ncbi:hypothetical protein MBANPS3_005740 [Mucor bainieri]
MTKITITKGTSINNNRSAIPRPLNSFMIFRMEHQASVSKKHPGATRQIISKILSTKWRGLTPEERQEYGKKALAAKEEHKLLYPDYKYRPRRREGTFKTKKSDSSRPNTTQTDELDGYRQSQRQRTDAFDEQQHPLPGTTFFNSLQAASVVIDLTDALDDNTLATTTCLDHLLLCPALSRCSYSNPSASPSTFSMMSQLTGLSPSLSSDYGTHRWIPFDTYGALTITDFMPPQSIFPGNQHYMPPAILDHIQPLLELDAQDMMHNLNFSSFCTYDALATSTPLLTQPFLFKDFEVIPY